MKQPIDAVNQSIEISTNSFRRFSVINFDAKLSFDDNAKFRQPNIFNMEDTSERDVREIEAIRAGLNYIGLQGNIGCLGKRCRKKSSSFFNLRFR